MIEDLIEKFQEDEVAYTNEEVAWLLDNIGHPKSAVRDGLIDQTLARGLYMGLFTTKQYRMIVDFLCHQPILKAMDQQGQATLLRSFAALLQTMVLRVDNLPDSPYSGLLSTLEKANLFETSLTFLKLECDFTVISPDFGLVHAIAHGADALTATVCHDDFDSTKWPEVFDILENLFKRLPVRFGVDEEAQLAQIIISPILLNKLPVSEFLAWLAELEFETINHLSYSRWSSFRQFLLTIYVELDMAQRLSKEDKRLLYQEINLG